MGCHETCAGYMTHLKTHQLDITDVKKQSLTELANRITPGNAAQLKYLVTYTNRVS